MDLDDQLAALAAGELDDDTARALRARVMAEPALREQLTRIQRLDERLTGWDVAPMTPQQVAALDDTVTAALDALDEGPLVTDRAPVVGLEAVRRRLGDGVGDGTAAAGVGAAAAAHGDVVDLGARRARRALPTWVSGLVAGAAAVAVVGTIGVGVTGRGSNDSGDDALATAATDDGDDGAGETERAIEEMGDDDVAGDAAMAEGGAEDEMTEEEMAEEDAAVGAVAAGPVPLIETGLVLADTGDLAAVTGGLPLGPYVDALERDDVDQDLGAVLAEIPASSRGCAEDRVSRTDVEDVTAFVGSGSYDGADAVVTARVVATGRGPVIVTEAHESTTCRLLDRIEDPV